MCSCEGTCTSATHKRRAKRQRAAARRAGVRKICLKKEYATRDEALADAVKLQNHDKKKRKRYIYQGKRGSCDCEGWHVTHIPQS